MAHVARLSDTRRPITSADRRQIDHLAFGTMILGLILAGIAVSARPCPQDTTPSGG